ncbi:hypothetical protein [Microcoleus sp.]|uniref:hypothetical protein n=1 Tax=Microcoleus sp. TaxID=44472 RepID=UPI00352654E7
MNLAQSGVALWKLDIQFYSQLRQFESIATFSHDRLPRLGIIISTLFQRAISRDVRSCVGLRNRVSS